MLVTDIIDICISGIPSTEIIFVLYVNKRGVFKEVFTGGVIDNILSRLTKSYLDGEDLDLDMLLKLVINYKNIDYLTRFYTTPLLLLLIKYSGAETCV